MHCVHCEKAARFIHPDITTVGRLDDKLIVSVDQIRDLKKDVYIVPNESLQKAYIVNDADSMNANAQNAFLQILEEPPGHAVFILSTGNPAALLPTVRSRCVELKPRVGFETVPGPDAQADENTELANFVTEFIGALASDNVKLMECMFRLDKFDRITFSGFLTLARESVALMFRAVSNDEASAKQKALVHAETVLIKAGEMLDLNVSTGNVAGYICASLIDDDRKDTF